MSQITYISRFINSEVDPITSKSMYLLRLQPAQLEFQRSIHFFS